MKRRSQTTTEIGDVESWLDAAEETFRNFEPWTPGDLVLVSLRPRILPRLDELEHVEFARMRLAGEHSVKTEPFAQFREILSVKELCDPEIVVSVSVDFEAPDLDQSKKQSDCLSCSLIYGLPGWSYRVPSQSEPSRRDAFEALIRIANLPVEIVDSDDNIYRFRPLPPHDDDFRVDPPAPWKGRHYHLAVRVPDDTTPPHDRIEQMRQLLDTVGSGKIFRSQWRVDHKYHHRLRYHPESGETAQRLFRAVATRPEIFVCKHYKVSADFRLHNLRGLEELRPLCHGRGSLEIALGYYRQRGDSYVNLGVETKADGYRLVVSSRGGFDVYGLEEKLGVRLG